MKMCQHTRYTDVEFTVVDNRVLYNKTLKKLIDKKFYLYICS